MNDTINKLAELAKTMSPRNREFAVSLVNQYWKRGDLSPKQWPWVEKLIEQAERPAPAAVALGEFKGMVAIFEKAASALKYPKVVLQTKSGKAVRLSLAGERAREPGSITVTDPEHTDREGRKVWLGRISRDGSYTPSFKADAEVVDLLKEFAADPAKVAADYGKATGNCCFCHRELSDPASLAVGYGPICADHYGLPH